jgi:branched-chain amino acid transport system substrate-binding protein
LTGRPRHWFASAVALALMVAAGAALPARAEDPFEIHAIISLTGTAAFLGRDSARALTIIESTTNRSGGVGGRPIKFVVHDDQSNPQIAVELMNVVVSGGAKIVLGSSVAAVCNAMGALAKDGPVVYCFSPGIHPAPGSFVFSSGIATADLLEASALYFRRLGWKKVGVITSSDATGQDADDAIQAAIARSGGNLTIVAYEHFNRNDISVSAQMAKLRASGAQIVIAWATGTPLGTLLRGANEAGLDVPVLTSAGNLSYDQMHAYAAFLPRMLLFPATPPFAPDQVPNGPAKAPVNAFVNALKAVGARPEDGSVLTWDATLTAIEALRKLGTAASAAQIRDFIANTRGFAGIYGSHDYRAIPQRGVGINSVIMVRWNEAKGTWEGVSGFGGRS